MKGLTNAKKHKLSLSLVFDLGTSDEIVAIGGLTLSKLRSRFHT